MIACAVNILSQVIILNVFARPQCCCCEEEEGDDAPDQIQGSSGARFLEVRLKSHYFLIFLGLVWGRFFSGWGKYRARFLASTRHDFVSKFQKSGKTDLYRHSMGCC